MAIQKEINIWSCSSIHWKIDIGTFYLNIRLNILSTPLGCYEIMISRWYGYNYNLLVLYIKAIHFGYTCFPLMLLEYEVSILGYTFTGKPMATSSWYRYSNIERIDPTWNYTEVTTKLIRNQCSEMVDVSWVIFTRCFEIWPRNEFSVN